jgi:hypothetical protein
LTTPVTNAIAFRGYFDQAPAPTLLPGGIVVIDNLPAHNGVSVRAAIQATGATSLLPLYSPFNPIKNAYVNSYRDLRKTTVKSARCIGSRDRQRSSENHAATMHQPLRHRR